MMKHADDSSSGGLGEATDPPAQFDAKAARLIFARLTDQNRKLEQRLTNALARLRDQAATDEQVDVLLRSLHEKSDGDAAMGSVARHRESQLRHSIACLSAELEEARDLIARLARERIPPAG